MTSCFGRWVPVFGLLVLFSGSVYAAPGAPFTESVVIFNTVCAKCHEAECSGRLSFDHGYEASRSHIIRHYGAAADKLWLQSELFSILSYTKEQCAYYPMDMVIPARKVWSGEMLQRMSTFRELNYFVPLGVFTRGEYRIELEMDKDVRVTVHLMSDTFDMVVEDCLETSEKVLVIPVTITEPGDYYFRLYPRQPVRINRLAITGDRAPGN